MGGWNGHNSCVCSCVCAGGVVCRDLDIREAYSTHNYSSYQAYFD